MPLIGAILSFTAFCRGKVCKGREELDEALLDREGGLTKLA